MIVTPRSRNSELGICCVLQAPAGGFKGKGCPIAVGLCIQPSNSIRHTPLRHLPALKTRGKVRAFSNHGRYFILKYWEMREP
jgi:hypothetical protein